MRLHNKSTHPFQHSYFDSKWNLITIEIKAGEIKEVDDKIAKIWLKTGKVVEFVEPKEAKALEDENAKLKEELAKLKAKETEVKDVKPVAAKKTTKKTAKKK